MMKTLDQRLEDLWVEPVIGLETHVELNTRSKMFCSCKNEESKEPNKYVCPICTWHVGVLPQPNAEAIAKTVKLGIAIKSKILDIIDWDRKHYEYPDLPKWFQLTQLEHPIVMWWEVRCIRNDGTEFSVDLDHIHLEEDAGKLVHKEGYSLVDFNRSGRALIEIVTKPSIKRIDDAIVYLESIQNLVRSLHISEADMEKGHLRSDISISLRKKGEEKLNERTEIKNLNSFKFAKDAINKEIETQVRHWEKTGEAKTDQLTVLWDEKTKTIKIMRTKENANDYRFIKEPDIPAIDISDLKKDIEVEYAFLPYEIEKKLMEVWLTVLESKYFSSNIQKAHTLFAINDKVGDLLGIAKILMNHVSDAEYKILDVEIIAGLLLYHKEKKFAKDLLKDVVKKILIDPTFDYQTYVLEHQSSGEDFSHMVDQVLSEKQDIVRKIQAGDTKKINVLVWEVIKLLWKSSAAEQIKQEIIKKISVWETDKEHLSSKDDAVEQKDKEKMVVLSTYRTHKIKELSEKDIGKEVKLTWWIASIRDHGDLVFIDLREDDHVFQVKFSKKDFPDIEKITRYKKESVILVSWSICQRDKDDINKKISSGTIELDTRSIDILSESRTLPFEIKESKKVNEQQRLQYRFLDLRNEKVKKNIVMRHRVIRTMREVLDNKDFIEVETPILNKGTDEWSREFIVPSRIHPGSFYVLPQAPQQIKQMLMVSGVDKYYQIARCFRDEDDKGDRQPEFTQLDMEMAFTKPEEVMGIIDELLLKIVKTYYPEKKILSPKIVRIPYAEAMEKYGSDKPDIRFGLEMKDITDIVKDTDFKVFKAPIEKWGIVKCIKVEKNLTKKDIEHLTHLAISKWLWGLAYIIVHEDQLQSPIIKYLGEDVSARIVAKAEAKPGDVIFFSASDPETTNKALDQVRRELGKMLKLYDDDTLAFCWITDFPMFEKTDEGKWKFTHNPFSMPKIEHIDWLIKGEHVDQIHAQQYDIVLNGNEIGWWSIRSHIPEILKATYKVMGYTKEQTQHSVGHMLDAFSYGVPPHGGIALGLDRLMMILQKESSIREVIAFPKNGSAQDLLFKSPSALSDSTLKQANIKII